MKGPSDSMADSVRPTRVERIYQALKVLLVQETFTLPEMKERLPEEIPGYVTQLVHQLEREGHLYRDNDAYYFYIHTELFDLNQEALELAAKNQKNFEEMGI